MLQAPSQRVSDKESRASTSGGEDEEDEDEDEDDSLCGRMLSLETAPLLEELEKLRKENEELRQELEYANVRCCTVQLLVDQEYVAWVSVSFDHVLEHTNTRCCCVDCCTCCADTHTPALCPRSTMCLLLAYHLGSCSRRCIDY